MTLLRFSEFLLREEHNYPKETKWENSPEQIKRRVARNRARRKAIKDGKARKGDGREVHHLGSHRKGSLDKVRTKVVSKRENRCKQPKRDG